MTGTIKTITCPDGSSFTVEDGTPGSNCSASVSNGVKTVTCPDGTSFTIADGEPGVAGDPGQPGTSTGTLSGTVTYKPGAAALPASNVTVSLVPTGGVANAVTAADGTYAFAGVPIGVYTVKFAGTGFTAAQADAVIVLAGKTTTLDKVLVSSNPITLVAPVATAPVGFGAADVALGFTMTRNPTGTYTYTYKWTPKSTNATAVTLSDDTAPAPTFTAPTLAAVLASGMVPGLTSSLMRKGFVPVSADQLAKMTYSFDCVVTEVETGYTKTVTVAKPLATLAPGTSTVPANQIVIFNFPGNTATKTFATKPGTFTRALNADDTANPWFIPDVVGDYEVDGLKFVVANFTSAEESCATCHDAATTAAVAAKFKEWRNSAHGNHFFKYFKYDSAGALVPIDANASLPTADPATFWKMSDVAPLAPMPLFTFGMTGGEGTHYSGSCVACHTTGWNALASNGGADEQGWTMPSLAGVITDPATPAPVMTLWNNASMDDVKKFAGMQCESCHGPLGEHKKSVSRAAVAKPVAEFDAAACAVCHDKPSNHDRVNLWKQSKHSDLELALGEAVVESRGTSTSCYRCHGAQGYVNYLSTKESNPDTLTRPTDAAVLSQAGFTACTPSAGHLLSTDPLDLACACRPAGCKLDTDCKTGQTCDTVKGLCMVGTAAAPCTPKAVACTPASGHRLSSEVYDPACPCKPSVTIPGPAIAGHAACAKASDCYDVKGICRLDTLQCVEPRVECQDDSECTSLDPGALCVGNMCRYPDCAADPAYYAYLEGLGLNEAKVQPQTCAACHDPHSTELRVEGDTGLLGNGTEMRGAGAGATCMVCHNSRNGARGDFISTSSISAPHAPVQTDLFLGANAYFMGFGGQVSKHAAVKDTCVGCHMTLHPDSIKPTNTNHTFTADSTICKNCHAVGVDLEALEGQFLVARGNLEKAFATALANKFGSGTPVTYSYYVVAINPATAGEGCTAGCKSTEVCDATESTPTCEPMASAPINLTKLPLSVVPSGRSVNLLMTFKDAMADPFHAGGTTKTLNVGYQNVGTTSAVKDWSGNLTTPAFKTAGIIAKANWNYWLVSSVALDASGNATPAGNVIHNPSFVFDVLSATSSQLVNSANAANL